MYPSGISPPDVPYPYTPIVPRWTMCGSHSASTTAVRRLFVPHTLLSTVYRFCLGPFWEYGAARCSAKWTIASGFTSRMSCSRRS